MTEIPAPMRPALERYLDELEAWNTRINLTRVPRNSWWSRHIEESVRLSALMGPARGRIVDVGSGCGVPGIPLAVLHPGSQIVLVESDQRKAGFLVHAAGVLGLSNVEVVAERAEVVGHDPRFRERNDAVVSRATAALPVLCELCLPLLRTGGRLYAMVAHAEQDAITSLAAAAACGGDTPRVVADGLVMVAKLRPAPDMYPRRTGLPGRHPLA